MMEGHSKPLATQSGWSLLKRALGNCSGLMSWGSVRLAADSERDATTPANPCAIRPRPSCTYHETTVAMKASEFVGNPTVKPRTKLGHPRS
jgi:hypothetical protein